MIDRRLMLHGLLLGAGALLVPRAAQAVDAAANAGMSRVTAYAFTFKGLDSGAILLSSYAGHPILVVNTASLCGYIDERNHGRIGSLIHVYSKQWRRSAGNHARRLPL